MLNLHFTNLVVYFFIIINARPSEAYLMEENPAAAIILIVFMVLLLLVPCCCVLYCFCNGPCCLSDHEYESDIPIPPEVPKYQGNSSYIPPMTPPQNRQNQFLPVGYLQPGNQNLNRNSITQNGSNVPPVKFESHTQLLDEISPLPPAPPSNNGNKDGKWINGSWVQNPMSTITVPPNAPSAPSLPSSSTNSNSQPYNRTSSYSDAMSEEPLSENDSSEIAVIITSPTSTLATSNDPEPPPSYYDVILEGTLV